MKKRSNIAFITGLIMLALMFSSVARGAETTLIVDLQKKIKSDFVKMEQVNREQEARTERLNREIKEIVTRLTNTLDEDRKEELKKLYFKKRAEHLQAEATRVVEIEAALSRIIKNMDALDREMGKLGTSKGISASDSAAVRDALKGTANILKTVQAVRTDDPRVNNLAMTLNNLDMQYRMYFNPASRTSYGEQIQYLEDLHAYIHSVRSLLSQETVYLRGNIFYMMKDGIVRVINDFQKQFYGVTFKGFESQHKQDEEVLGDRKEIERRQHQQKINLDNIGNW
jgi:hypothetical protein